MMRKSMMSGLLCATALLAATSAAIAEPVAVTGGKIVFDGRKAPIDNGTVVFDNGRILAVGPTGTVTIPKGARVVDASGKWVTPGLFDAFTRVGLAEAGADDASNDTVARTAKHSAALDLSLGFNPRSSVLPITRAEGVTRIAGVPEAGASLLGGYGFVADMSGAGASITKAKALFLVEWGEGGAGRAGGSRPAANAWLEAAFSDAERFPAAFTGSGEADVLRRADAEALQPVLRGEVPIFFRVNRASDITQVLAMVGKRPKLRPIIVGGAEAWVVARELAAAKVPVLLDPIPNLPEAFESLGATRQNVTRLAEAGVTFAIAHATGADAEFQARLLPQLAGNAVANGLGWGAAFAAITSAPAEILGLGGQLGTLAAGKIADVVVWDGDPLELSSSPSAVFINGVETGLTTRQTRLRDRYHPTRASDPLPQAFR